MVSIFCLMMILHGGFANPVADEGLLSWLLPEPIKLVTSEEVDGYLGDGKIFNLNNMESMERITSASDSEECCSKCQALNPEARFYVFSRNALRCDCYTPRDGVKPATMDQKPALQNEMPSPVAGVCGIFEHVAEPLQIPDSNAEPVKMSNPEDCGSGFVCCPHLKDGDNTLGDEIFVQQSQYKDSFASCEEACKVLHPFSNGVTESKSQVYKSNGKPLCWCEFGQAEFNQSKGYQTCLFKVEEDDYDY